jgi:uncharacterized membrane protein
LVLTALFAALITVGTMAIKIPIPTTSGYVNFGDTLIFASGIVLGPISGLLAGGIGSALADLLGGYAQYAPWTLVIKGLEGLIVGLIAFKIYARQRNLWLAALAMLVAGAWMVLGYFCADTIMYGYAAAVVGVVWNGAQAVGSLIIASLLVPQVYKALRRFQR